MKKVLIFIFVMTALLISLKPVFSFNVPEDNSGAKYFYVFGPQGNPDLGAEENQQELFIDVPADTQAEVRISIYDADTGGERDLKPGVDNSWDTTTEFVLYGKDNTELAKRSVSYSRELDSKYLDLGAFSKDQGELIGDVYRFKLTAVATVGDDENIYKVRISPASCEAFSYKMLVRLLEKENEKMYFYPEVKSGVTQIVVQNYDMDPNGGTGKLLDPATDTWYKIKDSATASWAETPVKLNNGSDRRLEYIITKKTQRHANAGMRFKDANGELLPIYFRQKGAQVAEAPKQEPVAVAKVTPQKQEVVNIGKCNKKFTFDGTKSSDPEARPLTYHWDFNDGSTAEGPVVTHEFESAGTYNVRLSVRNDSGLECDNSEDSYAVTVNAPPEPAFVASPTKACPDTEITFDASETRSQPQNKLTYAWDFGDGTKAEGVGVTKKYTKPGLYDVVLTVNDNVSSACSIATIQKQIEIVAPVVADAGEDIDLCLSSDKKYEVSFDASKSKYPAGSQVTYNWDFGDGTSAEGKKVKHVYDKGGTYKVSLTADDGAGLSCSKSTDTLEVNLNKQPFAEAGENKNACTAEEVSFDASLSKAESGDLKYTWDFGDGTTAEGLNATHSYKKGGKYYCILTVDDGKAKKCSIAKDTLNVNVNSQPKVKLSEVPAICINGEAKLEAVGSDPDSDKLTYSWDFGDGKTQEGLSKLSHKYEKGGEFVVRVTVSDGRSTNCSTASDTIKVRVNRPPVADAGPNFVCCVNAISNFDGSGSSDPDGDTLTYHWDFGDGATDEGSKVTHKYTKPGKYKVTLKVTDNSGTTCNSSTDSFEASVSASPTAVIRVR